MIEIAPLIFFCARYYVCVTLLIYFLPLCIMGCAYTTVGVSLWASEIPGDSSEHYKQQLTAKRKVIHTHTHNTKTYKGKR